MRWTRGLPIAAALAALPAQGFLERAPGEFQFFPEGVDWRLRIPQQEWKILGDKQLQGRRAFQTIAADHTRGLWMVVNLQRTDRCASGEACRALYWKNPGRLLGEPVDVKMFERNGFHVVQYRLDRIAGVGVRQLTLSASAYRDGHWIEMRMTREDDEIPDSAPFLELLDAASIR